MRGDQRRFVDSNLFCIAESRFEPVCQLLAVYRGRTMAGTVVISVLPDGTAVIEHLMVDGRFQGQGLGRDALLAFIERARSSGAEQVKLAHHPGNPAAGLYESAGFRHTGEKWDGDDPVMAPR